MARPLARHPSLLLLLALILPLDGCAGAPAPELHRVGLFEETLSIAVPTSFAAGGGSPLFSSILASAAVIETLIDPSTSARIDVARAPSTGMSSPRTTPPEGPLLDRYMQQIFGSRTDLDWIDNEVIDLDGKPVLYWDFTHGPSDRQTRTLMTMTTTPFDMIVVAFSFPVEFEETWTQVGREIVESLRDQEP